MVDFGDELIIESYKIPWLIWIQLLVTFLLILLLFFGFALSNFDAGATAAAPPDGRHAAPSAYLNNSISSNGIIAVEDQRAGGNEGTSGGSSREEEEDRAKDTAFLSVFRHPNHPCNYFGLAKEALFKCFGLDSSSESSCSRQHEHTP